MNTAQSDLIVLFFGVFVVLLLATIIGHCLKPRVAERHRTVVQNLQDRVNAWWLMTGLLVLSFLGGKSGVTVLFALCSLIALREFLGVAETGRQDFLAKCFAVGLILPMQYVFVWYEWYGLYSIFIPVYAFLLMPVLTAVTGSIHRYLLKIAEHQWALMICVFCASHVPALMTLSIPGYQKKEILLIAYLLLIVQMSDVLQYVFGKLIGKRPVAKNLSPSKTIEGTIGGILSATLIGCALWWITPFTPLQSGLMAFVCALMGFLGGLVLSAVKRDRGVKDWGTVIRGHGGVMDRLDSVLFSAPVFFHLVRYGWDVG